MKYDIIKLSEREDGMAKKITDMYDCFGGCAGEISDRKSGNLCSKDDEYYIYLIKEEENNYLDDIDDSSQNWDSGVIKYPHDLLFKRLFSDSEFFKDFLKLNLSEDLADKLDTETFQEIKTDFISKDLKEYYSDIIYSARIGDSEYQFAFLIEHKSYPDRRVTFQIFEYLLKLLEKSWSKKKFIQPVLAFLVYHGEGHSRLIDFNEEYSHLPGFISQKLLSVEIKEVNINELDPEQISDNLLYISYLLVSINRAENKSKHIEMILKELSDITDRKLQSFVKENIRTIFSYILNVTELSYDLIKNIISRYYSQEVDNMATTAEQLKKEGLEEGRKEELLESIKLMYKMKFDENISDSLMDNLEKLETEKLQKIRSRIPEMDSVNEIEDILA